MGFFDKIKQGLTKTKTKMDAQLTGIFAAYEPGDEEFFEDLEETLILADTGVETTTKAIAQLRKAIELKKLRTGAEVKKEFVQILTRILKVQDILRGRVLRRGEWRAPGHPYRHQLADPPRRP